MLHRRSLRGFAFHETRHDTADRLVNKIRAYISRSESRNAEVSQQLGGITRATQRQAGR